MPAAYATFCKMFFNAIQEQRVLRNASKTDSIKRHAGGGHAAGSTVQTDHKNQYDLSQFDYNEYKKLSSAGHAACLLPA